MTTTEYTTPNRAIASVAKAARILKTMASTETSLTLREISVRTGIPRSTVHTLCVTLAGDGLLEAVSPNGYRLGPTLLEAGAQIVDRYGLAEAAESAMRHLPRRPGFDAHLGLLVGVHMIYLDHRTYDPRQAAPFWLGFRAPAWLTGSGKAALSKLDPNELVRRLRRIDQTSPPLPDHATLHKYLEAARRRGFVVSTSFRPGRTSIAAPVTTPDGDLVGGLSVAAPTSMCNRRVVEQTIREVLEAAQETSRRIAPPPTAIRWVG